MMETDSGTRGARIPTREPGQRPVNCGGRASRTTRLERYPAGWLRCGSGSVSLTGGYLSVSGQLYAVPRSGAFVVPGALDPYSVEVQ